MGKPILTPIRDNSFVDGSEVFYNDAVIRGEIEGNIELSNIAEPKSLYTMSIGPIYFGPSRAAQPWIVPVVWTTSPVSILVWEVPRPLTVQTIQVHVNNAQPGGDTSGEIDSESGFVLNTYANLTVMVEYNDTIDGAYVGASGWTKAHEFTEEAWAGGSGNAASGDTATTANLASPKTIPAGKFARVTLSSTANTGLVLTQRTRAIITVTLYVEEDHVE